MARTDVAYTGEPELFDVAVHGCEFSGLLYSKVEGGCDAYLRLVDSDFAGLDTERITELRRRADHNKEIYVASLPGSVLNPLTAWRARRELRDWLCHSMGLEYRAKDRLKEWGWRLADLLDRSWWPGGWRW